MDDRNYDKKFFFIKNYHLYICNLLKMEGISNKTIVKFIAEKTSNDVKKFVGVFPSNCVIRFISFHRMMTESGARYPFIIIHTDRRDKKGTYWWGFLDLHPKIEIFLFVRFCFQGFKEFILKDYQKVLNKIRYEDMVWY